MTTLASLRADVLALMAQHAAIAPRGWDARRERDALHRKIDAVLDKHALEQLLWDESVPRSLSL